MTLHQCDRCGKQQESKLQVVDLRDSYEFPHTWELCSKCIDELRKFMQKGTK